MPAPLSHTAIAPHAKHLSTQRFGKAHHLCTRKQIQALFAGGSSSMTDYPLRMVYRFVPRTQANVPVQVMLSVAKRHLRHAVARNRAKRQLREAYRHEQHRLLPLFNTPEAADEGLQVAFVWLQSKPATTAQITRKVARLLQRLAERHATARCI